MNIPAPAVNEDIVAVLKVTPHERQILEQIVEGVKMMAQDCISDHCGALRKEIVEVVQISPLEWVQQRIVEHVVDVPVPQAVDEIIDVAQFNSKRASRSASANRSSTDPEGLKESVKVVRLIPQEHITERICEPIVDVPTLRASDHEEKLDR